MIRVAAVVTAAALLAASSAAAQGDGSLQGLDDGPPACSLVVTTPSDPRPAPRGAEAWVQCNFLVTRPRIRMRLGRPTCADPALRVRVTATGGLDCPPDEACPAIAIITRARSEGALGCA